MPWIYYALIICSNGGVGPQCVIANLAYLDFDDMTKCLRLGSIHPEVEVDTVKESTGFELIIPDKLVETKPPTIIEIELLRIKVDPLNIRKLEVLSGNEREELLDDIIQKELVKQNKFPMLLEE